MQLLCNPMVMLIATANGKQRCPSAAVVADLATKRRWLELTSEHAIPSPLQILKEKEPE